MVPLNSRAPKPLTLVGFESLDSLRANPSPVLPRTPDQSAVIDVIAGLRQIECHADRPLQGWAAVLGEDNRFEIAPDTSGVQLANALSDLRVLQAIEQLISPAPVAWPRSRIEASGMSGLEHFHQAADELIAALGEHLHVWRPSITGKALLRPPTQQPLF